MNLLEVLVAPIGTPTLPSFIADELAAGDEQDGDDKNEITEMDGRERQPDRVRARGAVRQGLATGPRVQTTVRVAPLTR